MARTVQYMVDTARAMLQDTLPSIQGFRYTTNDLARYLSEALLEMRRLRPDLFWEYGLETATPNYTESDVTSVIPVPDTYAPPIVNFMVGRAELRDDEFSKDGRAAMLLNGFSAALTSNGGKR